MKLVARPSGAERVRKVGVVYGEHEFAARWILGV
jgi:hypothetical protein